MGWNIGTAIFLVIALIIIGVTLFNGFMIIVTGSYRSPFSGKSIEGIPARMAGSALIGFGLIVIGVFVRVLTF